ncbi:[FeFe] hydrogenase H-cluster maturation GTPase HydF [Ethanoligenens sp.]|uniref:[FeFe] hydrogenase H-cluster maturation GTPase HydF n=1 Tax=Ethanoligenens sp. TaxID=2099655 RepID=UPI0039ED322E
MDTTPVANRTHIAFFGRRNAGKSSLLNAIAGQPVAVTSDVPGTTTDPVHKTMEILPLGPVLLTDTAGLDDTGELGSLRVEKAYEELRRTDLAVVVVNAAQGVGTFETAFIEELRQRRVPFVVVLNKCDLHPVSAEEHDALQAKTAAPVATASARTGEGISALRELLAQTAAPDTEELGLTSGLVQEGQTAVLVTPIDKAAPKGRLILPQQQTIRDILERDAIAVVTKEQELRYTLENLRQKPAVVITDSQAFLKVSADTPPEIPLTSFSILFARQKGDLTALTKGVRRIASLRPGDRVLIAEGCTHHRQSDDIGTVKIPRWIRQLVGGEVAFDWTSGLDFPRDIEQYAVVVHCGGCMLTRREMQYRIRYANAHGVDVTNYGMLIAYVQGILKRALQPFPAAALAYSER